MHEMSFNDKQQQQQVSGGTGASNFDKIHDQCNLPIVLIFLGFKFLPILMYSLLQLVILCSNLQLTSTFQHLYSLPYYLVQTFGSPKILEEDIQWHSGGTRSQTRLTSRSGAFNLTKEECLHYQIKLYSGEDKSSRFSFGYQLRLQTRQHSHNFGHFQLYFVASCWAPISYFSWSAKETIKRKQICQQNGQASNSSSQTSRNDAIIKILYKYYFSVMERIKQNQLPQDLFFKRPAKSISPKLDVNNTPIRQRDPPNKENVGFQNNKSKSEWNKVNVDMLERESLSNNFPSQNSVANSKTIPKRRVSIQSRGCVNHLELEAEFKIEIDGENLNYCNKCAAHLASNGFKVQRINSSRSPRRVKETGRSPYQKRKQELLAFMQSLRQLQNNYLKKEEHIQKVQKSHQIEKETISNFYSSLFEYLQYIKEQHLRFLQEQAQRNTQICEIEAGQISETLQQLKGMREDIEMNVDKIVEEVDASSYAECMTFYNQKKGLHEHRLEQLGNEARTANCTSAECIQQKLSQFKNFIDDLTGILSSKAQSGDY